MKRAEFKYQLGNIADEVAHAGVVVVAYGAGDDSTGMLCELVRLGIRIDYILTADTGSELDRTYGFIPVMSDWLDAHGYPRIQIVRNVPTRDSKQGAKKGVFEPLHEQLLRLESLPPPSYNCHSCSQKMKIRPQDAWLARQSEVQQVWAQCKKVLKLIGYEAGEGYRANRAVRETEGDPRFDLHFPLIEWGWDREACIASIKVAGLTPPGKSACFCCPMRKPHEIEELARTEPDKFRLALDLEARALASGKITNPDIKGLGGRKFAWSSLPCARPFLKRSPQ